jgi:phosphopantothenoylcysteine decarboxylase/phosphopantothenate--cysteine ligase
MGFAIADAARKRGAQVTAIAGVTSVNPPQDIRILRATSAAEMYSAVMGELSGASIFVGTAAVADYRPVERAARKIKKKNSSLDLKLERTTDILQAVARSAQDKLLVIGFAAETENVLNNAREKLLSKGLDAIVANDVTVSNGGFESSLNSVTILLRGEEAPVQLPLMPKTEVANRILDEVVRLRVSPRHSAAGRRATKELTKMAL